jgi:hypothetical protein
MTRTVWVEDRALSVPGLVLNLCDCLSIDQLKAYFLCLELNCEFQTTMTSYQ